MRIAYLALEIPALSATFVYNEIIELEKHGIEIFPFSVLKPTPIITDSPVSALQQRVIFLYGQSKGSVLISNLHFLFRYPLHYFKTLRLLFIDIVKVSFFSRTALGLVFRFLYAVKLAEYLIHFECQHIHAHFAHVPADLAMYASSLAGISFSVTAHANDLFERAWLLPEKVGRASFFVTISSFNKDFLAQQGANVEKVFIVHCGVDAEQFTQREFYKTAEVPTIGVVGRLVEKKGIDTLIRAVAELKIQGVLVKLKIAGSGPLMEELLLLVEQLGLNNGEVEFLGAMPHQQIAGFVSSLDAFVLPCKKDSNGDMDGIPVVLMEAMLSGVPVISTRLSGIPELVVDNETGLLVDPDNYLQLADAISKIISNKALRKVLTAHAIEKINNEYALSVNVKVLKNLFYKYVKG